MYLFFFLKEIQYLKLVSNAPLKTPIKTTVQKETQLTTTLNSKIFERFYFRETSRLRSFAKIKPSRNERKSCSSRDLFYVANIFITLFAKINSRENKILANMFDFTV